ncbi:MAG: hypothetical protein KC493_05300 [Bacteriovoracaceae bacterium]|nr:hypothetical protein [Bacteriovoracaceae bacterium]
MRIKTKINFKKYFGFTLLTTAFCCFFARDIQDIYGIITVYIAAVLNQFMLIELVLSLTESEEEMTKKRKWTLLGMAVGKMALLFGGISLGVHFMGNRVIIPLLNYVIQIFLLGVSFNTDDQREGKK